MFSARLRGGLVTMHRVLLIDGIGEDYRSGLLSVIVMLAVLSECICAKIVFSVA